MHNIRSPSHASPMFNPKSIRSSLTLSSLTPQSKGVLTIARLIEATNASPANPYDNPYAVITPPTPQLIVQTSCIGVRIDDKNPSFDREVPGAIDKTIYRCLIDDSTENRSIVAGMFARIVRSDGWVIEGVVDLVQYRTTGGIRIFIDASQNTGIDWAVLTPSAPAPTPPAPSPIADMTSDSVIIPYSYTDLSPKLIFNNTTMKTIFIARIVVQIPFDDPNAELFLGDYAQLDRFLSSTQVNPTVDPSTVGEYQTTPAWQPTTFNEMQVLLTIIPGVSTQGQGYVRLDVSG